MLMETDKRLGLWLDIGEELVIVRAVRYWLGDCLVGNLSLGDLRRSWTVTGRVGGNGMSSGAVGERCALVLHGPAPEASEISEKIPMM